MEYLTATAEMADAIYNILQTTIRKVYPKYYNQEVADLNMTRFAWMLRFRQ